MPTNCILQRDAKFVNGQNNIVLTCRNFLLYYKVILHILVAFLQISGRHLQGFVQTLAVIKRKQQMAGYMASAWNASYNGDLGQSPQ